jgi:6,7-dimethyl-8-ribityllumazine synthase
MSAKTYEGKLVAPAEARFAVVVGRFNEFVTSKLLGGAMDAFARHGVPAENVEVAWSPGSFEIPLLAQRMAATGQYATGQYAPRQTTAAGRTTTSTSPPKSPRASRPRR